MSSSAPSRRRALREAAVAACLLAAVVIAGANFVLVEVRLPGLTVTTRLGWVVLAALAAGFAAGTFWARR